MGVKFLGEGGRLLVGRGGRELVGALEGGREFGRRWVLSSLPFPGVWVVSLAE